MGKIWLIIQREYITRVKKRSFILTTLLAPAGFALFFLSIIFVSGYGESTKRIVVKDESGFFKKKFADDHSIYFFFSDSNFLWLEQNYTRLNYDGILLIPPITDMNNPRGIQYRSDKQLGIKSKDYVETQIAKVLREKKIEQANIDKNILKNLENTQVSITPIVYGAEGEKTGDTLVATGLGYIMGFVIYMVLFVYGAMVMKGVMEEKTSRIIEVMASSVRPFQLMMGKVVGIGAVGLTQFVLWSILIGIVNFILVLVFADKIADIQQMVSNPGMTAAATPEQYEAAMALMSLKSLPLLKLFFYFLFYFLGGYLIYGSLYAALGSATNDEGDSQSLTIFISIPIIISIFIMMSAIQEPDSSLAIWASIIPFTAPIVMPARIPFGPENWQIIVSMISVVIGFIFTTWIAAKIYRTGILMYGKKVTAKEILKWVVQSDAF